MRLGHAVDQSVQPEGVLVLVLLLQAWLRPLCIRVSCSLELDSRTSFERRCSHLRALSDHGGDSRARDCT